MPPSPDRRPGEGLVAVGVAVFLVGLAAVLVTVVPFVVAGWEDRPLALDLASFLAPGGLGLALLGLLRGLLADRRRARASADVARGPSGPPPLG